MQQMEPGGSKRVPGMGIEPEQRAHMGTDAHHQAEIVASTLLEPTATGFAEDTMLEPTAAVKRKQAANEKQTAGGANGEEAAVARFQECCEWPAEGTLLEPTAAGFAENTMLEPTAAAEARFHECLEEPEVTAGYEVGAEKETVAVPVAAENEVEVSVAGREVEVSATLGGSS